MLHRNLDSRPSSGLPGPEEDCRNVVHETSLEDGASSDGRIVSTPQGNQVVKRVLGKLKVHSEWLAAPTIADRSGHRQTA